VSDRADRERGRWGAWTICFADPEFFIFAVLAAVVLGALVLATGRAIHADAPASWFLGYCVLVAGTLAAVTRDLYRRRLGWASRLFLCAWGICFVGLLVGEIAG
jgi:lysylphosphatidylglycerol synthetase-like protein (DUF2156 family)